MMSRTRVAHGRAWPLILIALLLVSSSCARLRPPRLTPAQRAFVDLPASEWASAEREDEMDITIPAFDPLTAADPAEQIKMRFRGADRKVPKTSIASATREDFDDLDALMDSLEEDDDMRNRNPPIERDTMVRVAEERRNVRVSAWIYAIKYEADQDWHVIIGTDPSATDKTYFNAEISGLPGNAASSYQKLLSVRESLANILENELPSGSSYRKYTEPIPVIVDGSLFFDVDHAAGTVGPAGMRPDTAWEIHPVTRLRLQ
jgi:hypothetical protein